MNSQTPNPKLCRHKDLEFELGGKVLSCRDCGQTYHAATPPPTGFIDYKLDPTYYNIYQIHKDRRTWAPALIQGTNAGKPPA